jgi:hypothetical protein
MWELEAPDSKLSLHVEVAFPAQEFATVISKPAFWEGRMNAKGKMRGRNVAGPAYIERHGFLNSSDLNSFLKAVSKQTLKSVRKILPLSFGQEKFEELVSKRGNKHLTEGMDKKVYAKTFIQPIRADRRPRGQIMAFLCHYSML